MDHTALLNLLPQHSISLEENSSPEQLIEFKKQSLLDLQKLVGALCQTHPELDAETWTTVVKLAVGSMSELWPMATPSDMVVDAARVAGWDDYPWDFKLLMKPGLVSIIREAQKQTP